MNKWIGLLAVLILTGLGGCSNDDEKSNKVELPEMMDSTRFPTEATNDYAPKGYLAQVAFPGKEGARIWVKGSKEFPSCQVAGKSWHLKAPYYTDIISVDGKEVNIHFVGTQGLTGEVILYPKSTRDLEANGNFSILSYGCFQPFHVNDTTGEPTLRKDTSQNEWIIRKAFRDVALGHKYPGLTPSLPATPLIPLPLAVLATGDQVYVDAAYYTTYTPNPISAWSVGPKPMPTLNEAAFKKHLDRTYRNFGAFTTMEEVFAHLPVLSIWDDHEIRDGWGSQGDEYPDSLNGFDHINPRFKPYFMAAYQAYIDHQWSRGPMTDFHIDTVKGSALYQAGTIGGTPVFAMDLRSQRNINTHTVMDETQFQAIDDWLNSLQAGQTAIIMSSVPLFVEVPKSLKATGNVAKEELTDDIADAWGSDANREQRNRLFQLLVKYREEKDLQYIVLAGDIHVGALNEVWYRISGDDQRQPRILSFEMVVSGLSHKGLADQSWSSRIAEMMGKNGHLAKDVALPGSTSESFEVYAKMQATAAKLNFAAVEFTDRQWYLNLFFKDNDKFEQVRMPLNFQKSEKDYEWDVQEFKTKASSSTYVNKASNIQQRVVPEYK